MDRRLIGAFEILTLVIASFSFAYIVGETNNYFDDYEFANSEERSVLYLREKILSWLSKGVVSAQGSGEVTMQTCIQNLNGTICQEYSSLTCESQCASTCIPTTRENTAECRIGTCYDSVLGTCNDGTPRFACESSGGVWSATRPAQCNRNCCLINPDGNGGGEQARYTTQQECNYLGQTLGLGNLGAVGTRINWVNAGNEVECLLMANTQAEGACVLEFLPEENAYNCEFTKKTNCLTFGGDFYEGKLCTNTEPGFPDTICEKDLNGNYQTSCFEDSDEVYFIDTCGNKANIYDSTKIYDANYWNVIVPKSQSCNLGTGNNQFSNQDSCGSCEYLLGSVCGTPISGKDVGADYGDYVCRDLRCLDYQENTRQNGESWCRFDSRIGTDGLDGSSAERSVDVPGSRHYREVCFDGEVRLEPCQDFRNELCVESEDVSSGFTSANCRINLWQQCIRANENQQNLNKCEENTDCFLKHVDVDEYFEFDICTSKYPPGFDLTIINGEQAGGGICSAASQTCTYIEQKGVDGWSCVANCNCLENDFAEQMNNLCISLGDCGGHINLAGEFSDDGYSVSGSDALGAGYVNGLRQYKTPRQGQRVEPLSVEELAALLGIPTPPGGGVVTAGEIAGWVLGLGGLGMAASLVILEFVEFGSLAFAFESGYLAATSQTPIGGLGPWANWAAAAAVGAAIGFILSQVLGLQGDAVLAVTLGGAAGGAISYALGAELFVSSGFWLGIGIGIAIALVLVFALGLGETREKQVSFTCRPWQPPTGGDNCEICNEDDLECSKYKCDSLGQNCELINEGTDEASCIDINPNDSNAPVIDKWDEAIDENYEYVNAQVNVGTEIELNQGDGCIKEYTSVEFGIELNEPGQCKFSEEHTANYEEMSSFFGNPSSNLYKFNHSTVMAMPTLSELGVSGVGPGRRGDYDLYIRCQDSSGNSNTAEYVVNFCVKPADDLTAPVITEFVPESPGAVGFNVSEFNLQFYTNEPATCRYSNDDKEYNLMENNALCLNEISAVTLQGWSCLAVLPVSGENTDNYYFRCADQPWLGQNNTGGLISGRNANGQSTEYMIEKTTTPLDIYDITPNGQTLSFGSTPATAVLEIKTRGGINNNALCEYSFNNGVSFTPFFETGGQIHRNTFNQLIENNYDIDLMCTDSANNVATAEAVFSVEIDNIGPLVTRVYSNSGVLSVITNEISECRYSNENCAFTFSEGVAMNGQNYLHTTSLQQGMTYRIKCEDGFGNVGQCLTVSAGY